MLTIRIPVDLELGCSHGQTVDGQHSVGQQPTGTHQVLDHLAGLNGPDYSRRRPENWEYLSFHRPAIEAS